MLYEFFVEMISRHESGRARRSACPFYGRVIALWASILCARKIVEQAGLNQNEHTHQYARFDDVLLVPEGSLIRSARPRTS
jgi:hypothetical protein